MENKVYFAHINDDEEGVYVAAKNIKEAKKIAEQQREYHLKMTYKQYLKYLLIRKSIKKW